MAEPSAEHPDSPIAADSPRQRAIRDPGDDRVGYWMRHPWTIDREDGDEPGDIVLKCRELPSVIGYGRNGAEAEADFWLALRLTLECYADDGETPPMPALPHIEAVTWMLTTYPPTPPQFGVYTWDGIPTSGFWQVPA